MVIGIWFWALLKAFKSQDSDAILDLAIAVLDANQAARIGGIEAESDAPFSADFRKLLDLELGHHPDDGKPVDS